MIETIIVLSLIFLGSVIFRPLPAMKDEISCEEYQNPEIEISAIDVKQHFYHGHKPRIKK